MVTCLRSCGSFTSYTSPLDWRETCSEILYQPGATFVSVGVSVTVQEFRGLLFASWSCTPSASNFAGPLKKTL